jgi:hypothetical protein
MHRPTQDCFHVFRCAGLCHNRHRASQFRMEARGSTCGPDGTNGDFRYAQSTDNYLVWCMRPSYEQFPTWNFAKP